MAPLPPPLASLLDQDFAQLAYLRLLLLMGLVGAASPVLMCKRMHLGRLLTLLLVTRQLPPLRPGWSRLAVLLVC